MIVLFSEQIRLILVITHVINDTGKGVTIPFNFPYFFPKIATFVGEKRLRHLLPVQLMLVKPECPYSVVIFFSRPAHEIGHDRITGGTALFPDIIPENRIVTIRFNKMLTYEQCTPFLIHHTLLL